MKLAARKQLAFYGSTPAYRPTLDAHGWGDLHVELNPLAWEWSGQPLISRLAAAADESALRVRWSRPGRRPRAKALGGLALPWTA